MSPYTPPSIKDKGLQPHLDMHYSKYGGYGEFVALVNAGVAKKAMAKRFGVSRPTMDKWISIHNTETKDEHL